jgi:hypothetical protein
LKVKTKLIFFFDREAQVYGVVSYSRGVYWESALFTRRFFPHVSGVCSIFLCGAVSDSGKVIVYVVLCPVWVSRLLAIR